MIPAQAQEAAIEGEKRSGIIALALDVPGCRIRAQREPGLSCTETSVERVVPLHRRALRITAEAEAGHGVEQDRAVAGVALAHRLQLVAGLEGRERGVEGVVILNGKTAHAVLLELFTEHGAGTLIVP